MAFIIKAENLGTKGISPRLIVPSPPTVLRMTRKRLRRSKCPHPFEQTRLQWREVFLSQRWWVPKYSTNPNVAPAQMFHQPHSGWCCESADSIKRLQSIRFFDQTSGLFLDWSSTPANHAGCSVWHWFTIHKHFKHWFNFQKQIKNICVASINISNISLFFKKISNIDLPFGLAFTNISSVSPFYVFYPQEMHLGPKLPNIFSKSSWKNMRLFFTWITDVPSDWHAAHFLFQYIFPVHRIR